MRFKERKSSGDRGGGFGLGLEEEGDGFATDARGV